MLDVVNQRLLEHGSGKEAINLVLLRKLHWRRSCLQLLFILRA
jgi:hypothetical protein